MQEKFSSAIGLVIELIGRSVRADISIKKKCLAFENAGITVF